MADREDMTRPATPEYKKAFFNLVKDIERLVGRGDLAWLLGYILHNLAGLRAEAGFDSALEKRAREAGIEGLWEELDEDSLAVLSYYAKTLQNKLGE